MLSTGRIVAIGSVLAVIVSGIALAQMTPSDHPMGPDQMQEMIRQHHGKMPMGNRAGMHPVPTTPTMPGQDAFGAIQDVVGILDTDPKTDWSKVDLEALRQP